MNFDFNKFSEASQQLDRALMLQSAGASVIPCGSPACFKGSTGKQCIEHCKQPKIKWKEYQDTPPTEQQIRKWWQQWPGANIAILTGELVVVDADTQEAIDWIEKYLPETPIRVDTAKGRHFYYQNGADFQNTAGFVDIRGFGGYVLAAGSVHGTGVQYRWNILPVSSEVAA